MRKGKLDVTIVQQDDTTCDTTMNVIVLLGSAHHLMSLLLLLQEGWMMKSIHTENPINGILKLQHEKQPSFAFGQIIKSGESTLRGLHIV